MVALAHVAWLADGHFNVNMGFTNDDRILIQNLYILKAYGAKNFSIEEFPAKGWALSSLNKLWNYLNILPVCFASFFLASYDVIALKTLPFQIS